MTTNPMSPGATALVTAGAVAASITIPAAFAGQPHQLQVQVAAGANAAFTFVVGGTAAAPTGTPSNLTHEVLGGTAVTWTIDALATAISYIRVGAVDATVICTWGMGE